mmetsp:Transcript_59434/g.150824  ORF Transcript_59434/g.150824 Transcript_59434/m.150824 type:complete len:152 (-) Transcript_59434:510-965(-)
MMGRRPRSRLTTAIRGRQRPSGLGCIHVDADGNIRSAGPSGTAGGAGAAAAATGAATGSVAGAKAGAGGNQEPTEGLIRNGLKQCGAAATAAGVGDAADAAVEAVGTETGNGTTAFATGATSLLTSRKYEAKNSRGSSGSSFSNRIIAWPK